jgi:exosortase
VLPPCSTIARNRGVVVPTTVRIIVEHVNNDLPLAAGMVRSAGRKARSSAEIDWPRSSSNTLMSSTVRVITTSTEARLRILWPGFLLGLLVLLYAGVFKVSSCSGGATRIMVMAFFVPLLSFFILWRERERLTKSEVRPSNFGFVVMLGAVGLLLLGSLGAELFISRFSMLVLLTGMILFLAGWDTLRAVSFPLSYLIWMIPIPIIIYNQITFPLQLVASRLATAWLELVQVPVLRDGNVLVMSNYSLEVVEACSGIRSLMTLIALAVAYGYLVEPRRWVRYVLVLLMIPSV